MNEIITARDIDIVTAEINTIKVQTQRMIVANAIEIGRRLVEAKSMVPHGEWGKYLQEQVDYSQSTANNLMRLYEEYGDNQESLFDSFTKSQAFGNLTYTKALALLAIPADEREEFTESHDVENMSTRELERAIRAELESTKTQLANAEQRAVDAEHLAEKRNTEKEAAEAQARDAEQSVIDIQQRLAAAKSSEDAWQQEIDKMKTALCDANFLVKEVKKQLAEAQAAEAAVRAELKKTQEDPTVPDAVMEQMRKEVEAEAAKQATAELQKKLDAALKSAGDAARAKEAAEAAARAAQEQLADAQKAVKLANPDVAVFNNIYTEVQMQFNRLTGSLKKIRLADPATGEKLQKAVSAMLDKLQQDISKVEG